MDQEDIQSKLIQKLTLNLITNTDVKYVEKYSNYLNRLLNSRLNVSTNNETNIMNMIQEKVSKLNNSKFEKIERIQNLYSTLVNKKTIKRRWAILYLLLRISTPSNDNFIGDTSKILQAIFHDDSQNMINPHLTAINNINESVNESQQVNIKTRQQIVVVNTNKYNKIITEKDLINDLVFVFQGIDGHYINFNSLTNSYTLNPLIPFNDNIYEIVSILTELGWLYKKVSTTLKFFNESSIPSQFIQSFSYAIQSELSEYYKLISLFKKMNTKIEENSENADELSLKKLLLWTLEPIERMKWIAITTEAILSISY
jgi:hypothetical protein